MNYYRLKHTDALGSTFYYKVLALNNIQANSLQVRIVQNPTNLLNLIFNTPQAKRVKMEVLDVTGKRFSSESFQINIGETTIRKSIGSLARGLYVLRIATNEKIFSKKFQKF
jgi:hypothetical protein